MEKLTFDSLPQLVANLIEKIESLEKEITTMRTAVHKENLNELMTRKQTASYFKCDISTLDLWTRKGKLKRHCIGHRVYYKRSELEEATINIR